MGRRIDEAVWNERRELLERQALSGLSAARFCREQGVKLGNFQAWKRKFNGHLSAEWAGSAARSESGRQKPSSFVQVPIQAVPRMAASSWIEVSSAAGIVVRVPAGNLPALQMVLESLCEENAND